MKNRSLFDYYMMVNSEDKDLLDYYLDDRKFKKRNFKKVSINTLIASTIAAGVISGTVFYNIGKNSRTNTSSNTSTTVLRPVQKTHYVRVKENAESQSETLTNGTSSEDEEKNVVDYILTLYNAKGNDLSRDDLGLVKMSPIYLFQNQEDKLVMDPMNKDGSEYKNIKDSDKNEVYIYVDNNTSKPVAGITNIYDKSVNVYVKSYSSIDGSNENISLDNGDYVNLNLSNEEMEKFYEQTLDYFDERMRKASSK